MCQDILLLSETNTEFSKYYLCFLVPTDSVLFQKTVSIATIAVVIFSFITMFTTLWRPSCDIL